MWFQCINPTTTWEGKKCQSNFFFNFCLVSQSRKPPLIMLWTVSLPQNPTLPRPWGNLASQVEHTEFALCFLGTAGTASEHLQPVLGRGRDCFVLNNATVPPLLNGSCVAAANISCSKCGGGRQKVAFLLFLRPHHFKHRFWELSRLWSPREEM